MEGVVCLREGDLNGTGRTGQREYSQGVMRKVARAKTKGNVKVNGNGNWAARWILTETITEIFDKKRTRTCSLDPSRKCAIMRSKFQPENEMIIISWMNFLRISFQSRSRGVGIQSRNPEPETRRGCWGQEKCWYCTNFGGNVGSYWINV